MSRMYNNESDQIIINEVSDEDEKMPHVEDNTAAEMVLPVISSVYSENPDYQNQEESGSADIAAGVSQQDNDSSMTDSDIELVSVDYTNDTLSDSSDGKNVQTIKRKRSKHHQMLPNPCESNYCRNSCHLITNAERKVIFEEFRSLNPEAKKEYIHKWVTFSIPEQLVMGGKVVSMKTTRDYYLPTQNDTPIKVCAKFFTATLGITLAFVTKYVKEKINEAVKSIAAGQELGIHVDTQNVSNWIDIAEMIRQIEKREEIWKQDLTGQKRNVAGAWDDICNAIIDNYSRQTEVHQKFMRKKLIAKWCNLKKSYFKYFTKKRQLQTSNSNETLPFMAHSHLLTFLDSTFLSVANYYDCSSDKPDGYATVFIMEDHQSVDEPTEPSFAVDENRRTKKPKLGKHSNSCSVSSPPFIAVDHPSQAAAVANGAEEFSATQKSNATEKNIVSGGVGESEQSDLDFFKSLLPIIKTLDQEKRLQFRLGVITNLQKLTVGESRKNDAISDSSSSQQGEISKAAPQNPVITSTSFLAGRSSTDNVTENRIVNRSNIPKLSVLISSDSDDSDC
nr:unnamed protein product [Callosobruchus chinensis]